MAKIESIARESRVFPPPPAFVSQANIGKAEFDRLNAAAEADFPGFWAKLARDELVWHKPFTKSIEGVVAMQACARIGATHSVVFGGFSAKSLQERIIDAGAVAVICSDEQMRGGKALPIKAVVDEAIGMGGCEAIKTVVVYRRTGN